VWTEEQPLGKQVNIEPLLNLLSNANPEECAGFVDEAIRWLLACGASEDIDLMQETYDLFIIRDMFLEMAQSSKTGN
jgi:hypothetical protein